MCLSALWHNFRLLFHCLLPHSVIWSSFLKNGTSIVFTFPSISAYLVCSANLFYFSSSKLDSNRLLYSSVSHETSMQNSEANGAEIILYKYNSVEFDFTKKIHGAFCLEWQRQWRNLGMVSVQMGVWNSGVQSSTMNGAFPLWWAPTLTWSDSLNQDSVILKWQQQ